MEVKALHLPDGTRRLFGRKRPVSFAPRLELKNYLKPEIPAPPPVCGYMRAAKPEVHRMYLNDQIGCCVESAVAHAIGVFGAQNQARWFFSDEEIVKMYSDMGGFVPDDPSTDQGTNISDALRVWQTSGVSGPGGIHKIVGSVSVDITNHQEYKTAIWLFENLILGLELPDAWTNPFPSENGFVWHSAGHPDPEQGHCILATNYDEDHIYISTWGMNGVMTNAAFQKYCAPFHGGEVFAVLSEDIINRAEQRAPNGINFHTLIADIHALG